MGNGGRFAWYLAALVVCLPDFAGAKIRWGLLSQPVEYTLSFENITSRSPADFAVKEDLGLVGARYRLLWESGLDMGIGAFFATTGPGKRGGFIEVGGSIGYRFRLLPQLSLFADLFLGGGGGGNVPTGSGLMVRPAVGLGWSFNRITVEGGYSYTRFPGGPIGSHQPYLQLRVASAETFAIPQTKKQRKKSLKFTRSQWRRGRWRIIPAFKSYLSSGKVNRIGLAHGSLVNLVGLQIEPFLDSNLFTSVQLFGAFSGGTGGYMSIAGGLGYSFPFGASFRIEPILIGAFAGGGNVDTGSGPSLEPTLRLVLALSNSYSLHVQGGYLLPFNGSFQVPVLAAGLSIDFRSMQPKRFKSGLRRYRKRKVWREPWRFSFSTLRYFTAGVPNVNGVALGDIDLFGLSFDYFLNSWTFINLSSHWPYSGNAGGYGAGLLGIGAHWNLTGDDQLYLEARGNAGAAAGGGIPAGSGGMILGATEFGINLWDSSYFFVGTGILTYFGGTSSKFVEGGLRFRFDMPWRLGAHKRERKKDALRNFPPENAPSERNNSVNDPLEPPDLPRSPR